MKTSSGLNGLTVRRGQVGPKSVEVSVGGHNDETLIDKGVSDEIQTSELESTYTCGKQLVASHHTQKKTYRGAGSTDSIAMDSSCASMPPAAYRTSCT